MRLYVAPFIIAFSLIACTGKNRLPGGIIAPKVMQELVWDVMVADEYSREILLTDTIRNRHFKQERSMIYQQVFDLHKTSREEFVKSFNYYTTHPGLTKALFDTLTVRANKRRDESFRAIVPRTVK